MKFMIDRLPQAMQDNNTTRGAKPPTKAELKHFDALTGVDPDSEPEVKVKAETQQQHPPYTNSFNSLQQGMENTTQ